MWSTLRNCKTIIFAWSTKHEQPTSSYSEATLNCSSVRLCQFIGTEHSESNWQWNRCIELRNILPSCVANHQVITFDETHRCARKAYCVEQLPSPRRCAKHLFTCLEGFLARRMRIISSNHKQCQRKIHQMNETEISIEFLRDRPNGMVFYGQKRKIIQINMKSGLKFILL